MQTRSLAKDRLPRSLVQTYADYSFTAEDHSFAFAYDSTSDWSTVTQHAQALLQDWISPLERRDTRLAAQEMEFMRKLGVCWRDRGLGTLYTADPATLSCSNAAQARHLRPYLANIGRRYASAVAALDDSTLKKLFDGGRVVIAKGKGAPYFFPGSDRVAAFALAKLAEGATSYDDIADRTQSAGSARLPFCQTSYIRIQSAAKPTPAYAVVGGDLQSVGERYGPKVRRIGAQPFVINHLWAPAGAVLRAVMTMIDDRNTGTFEPAARLGKAYRYAIALDLASYDTTVALETLRAFTEVVTAPFLHALVIRGMMSRASASLLLDIAHHTDTMPILMPPRRTSEAAYLADAAGQTRSGINWTSIIGTVVNRCLCDLRRKETASGGEFINYGDDTIGFTNDARDIQRWADAPTLGGFNVTIAPDATFLMRRVPDGYSYLGRMLMGCIDREKAHEPQSIVAATAAFATRAALLVGHPAYAAFDQWLASTPGPARLRQAALSARSAGPTRAVALTSMAAALTRGLPSALEDQTKAMQSLVANPNIPASLRNAAIALEARLEAQAITERTNMTWVTFQSEVKSMSRDAAIGYIRSHAY